MGHTTNMTGPVLQKCQSDSARSKHGVWEVQNSSKQHSTTDRFISHQTLDCICASDPLLPRCCMTATVSFLKSVSRCSLQTCVRLSVPPARGPRYVLLHDCRRHLTLVKFTDVASHLASRQASLVAVFQPACDRLWTQGVRSACCWYPPSQLWHASGCR